MSKNEMMAALYAYAQEAQDKTNREFVIDMDSELWEFLDTQLMADMVEKVDNAGYEMEYSTQMARGRVDLYSKATGMGCGTYDYEEEVGTVRGMLLEAYTYEDIVNNLADMYIEWGNENDEDEEA